MQNFLLRPALILALAALIIGCAPVVPHLAPTPALLKDERLDFVRALPPALKSTRLPVYFATTRAATESPEHFGNATGEGVTLGVARVQLGTATGMRTNGSRPT
jgi:hypothetical protein